MYLMLFRAWQVLIERIHHFPVLHVHVRVLQALNNLVSYILNFLW